VEVDATSEHFAEVKVIQKVNQVKEYESIKEK